MKKFIFAILSFAGLLVAAHAIGTRQAGNVCKGACLTAIAEYQPSGNATVLVPGLDYDGTYTNGTACGTFPTSCYTAVSATISTKTLVLIVLGQSEPANYSNHHYFTLSNNVHFLDPYNNTVYQLNTNTAAGNTTYAPILGGSGYSSLGSLNCASSTLYCQGTWLGALGDCLLAVASNVCGSAVGIYSRIIIINVAAGSTSVGDWTSGVSTWSSPQMVGLFNNRLLVAWRLIVANGWNSNANAHIGVLYSQGEQDGATWGSSSYPTTAQWETAFGNMVSSYVGIGGSGSWFVVQETGLPGVAEIQTAQLGVLGTSHGLNVYAGASGASGTGGISCTSGFDSIPSGYRWDGIHFGDAGSGDGVPMAANCVYNAISAHPP